MHTRRLHKSFYMLILIPVFITGISSCDKKDADTGTAVTALVNTFANPLLSEEPLAGQGCADFRNPRIQKFTRYADGTPNFGTPVSIHLSLQKPSGE